MRPSDPICFPGATGMSRRTALVFVASATWASALSGCSVTGVFSSDAVKVADDHTAAALPLVNQLRAAGGLAPLSIDKAAQRAAAAQARRMADSGRMAHLIGFGDDFSVRMKRMQVQLPAAENIATGQESVDKAVEAWVNSEKHRLNMLGTYRGLGVAVAKSASSGDRPFWAMILSG